MFESTCSGAGYPGDSLERHTRSIADSEGMMPCSHHWVLEDNQRPISKGVCKYCGEEREFRNYMAVGQEILRPDRLEAWKGRKRKAAPVKEE